MSQMSDDLQKQLQRGLEELRTLRDDIRVRLHLASMEAKTRWNEDLEPRFHDFEHRAAEVAKDVGDKAADAARKALSEMTDAYHSFRDALAKDKDKDKGDKAE